MKNNPKKTAEEKKNTSVSDKAISSSVMDQSPHGNPAQNAIATHPKNTLIPPHSIADNIPLLDQIANESERACSSNLKNSSLDPKKLQTLRKKFELEMNKKIRRTLQETERSLQKEMQNELDQLFKKLSQ